MLIFKVHRSYELGDYSHVVLSELTASQYDLLAKLTFLFSNSSNVIFENVLIW